MRIRAGLEPECRQLLGEKRAVGVSLVAANEFAAGENDDRARPRHYVERIRIPLAVTSTTAASVGRSSTARPFSRASRFCVDPSDRARAAGS